MYCVSQLLRIVVYKKIRVLYGYDENKFPIGASFSLSNYECINMSFCMLLLSTAHFSCLDFLLDEERSDLHVKLMERDNVPFHDWIKKLMRMMVLIMVIG